MSARTTISREDLLKIVAAFEHVRHLPFAISWGRIFTDGEDAAGAALCRLELGDTA